MIDLLRRDGIAPAPRGLSIPQVLAVREHLSGYPVVAAHVWAKGHGPMSEAKGLASYHPVLSYHMDAIVLAPHFLELVLACETVAADYFGEPPRLYSMNAFWTKPGGYEYQDTHGWHRDGDDRKQLVMFTYGTDVLTEQAGAHKYQRCTVDLNDQELGYQFTDPPVDRVVTMFGGAGTTFFSDTRGLHVGVRPNRPRLLLWARWGVSERPASYDWDCLAPVPATLLAGRLPNDLDLRERIKLVVA